MDPTDYNRRFESLSSALAQFGKGSTSEPEAKGYITSQDGNVHFVTDFSVAKKEKGLSLTKLADTVEKVITAAANSPTYEVKTDATIDEMITGMEALKTRISSAKNLSLWDKLLSSLGIETKYDVALAKIDAMINLAKATFIPRQIALLKAEEELLESDISKLTPPNQFFFPSMPNIIRGRSQESEDLEKKSQYEEEIGNLELSLVDLAGKNLELEEKKEALVDKKNELMTQRTQIITTKGLLSLEQEIGRLEGINKKMKDQREIVQSLDKGVIGGFLSKALGSSNEELNNAKLLKHQMKESIKEKFGSVGKLEQIIKEKKETLKAGAPLISEIEREIRQSETQMQQIAEAIEKNKVAQTQNEKKITPLKAKLDSVNNRLENAQILNEKKARLVEVKDLIKEKELKLEEVPKNRSNELKFFKLPENKSLDPVRRKLAQAFSAENRLLDTISAELGLIKGKIEEHTNFLRLAMFGFSGQKIDKETLGVDGNLSEIIEGGRATDNMFYICHHFEKLLDKNEHNKDSSYIQGIEKLQSDLIESLPFAFENTLIDAERGKLNSSERLARYQGMSSNISKKLLEMQPGQSLFVPTGVTGHQTLLVLKKEANNKISTTFYNTGHGIEHNSPEREGDIIQREYISRIYPSIDLEEKERAEDFESMMTDLFQIQSDKNKDVPDIHTALRQTLGEGKAGRASEQQMGGVCSYQVLTEAFKDHLGKNYNQHRLDLLTENQEAFRAAINTQGAVTGNESHVRFISRLDVKLLEENGEEIKKLQKKVK